MNDQAKELIARGKKNIRDLKSLKADLRSNLNNVHVQISLDENPNLRRAIEAIFGEQNKDDPNYGYITFDMYRTCLSIIRMAGEAKAEQVINGMT